MHPNAPSSNGDFMRRKRTRSKLLRRNRSHLYKISAIPLPQMEIRGLIIQAFLRASRVTRAAMMQTAIHFARVFLFTMMFLAAGAVSAGPNLITDPSFEKPMAKNRFGI